jgi:hypothetical protein
MADRRALIAADIGDAGLEQTFGDGEDPLALEPLAIAEAELLDLLLKERSAI